MDKIDKALRGLSEKERQIVREILIKLSEQNTVSLDIKKLKEHTDVFRIRKGHVRIIYRVDGNAIFLLSIERRREDTYKF